MRRHRRGFSEGGFDEGQVFRDAVEKPRRNLNEFGESAVHEVTRGALGGAGKCVSTEALAAMAAGERVLFGYDPVTDCPLRHRRADLGDLPREFVADNDRRCVGVPVILNLQVAPADTTGADSNQHSVPRDVRRGHIAQFKVAGATRSFEQGSHRAPGCSISRITPSRRSLKSSHARVNSPSGQWFVIKGRTSTSPFCMSTLARREMPRGFATAPNTSSCPRTIVLRSTSNRRPGLVAPPSVTRPPRRVISMDWRAASALPANSITRSAPCPAVKSRTAPAGPPASPRFSAWSAPRV